MSLNWGEWVRETKRRQGNPRFVRFVVEWRREIETLLFFVGLAFVAYVVLEAAL